MPAINSPDYRAFVQDLMALCKKHGVTITAFDGGFVGVGPASVRTVGEYEFTELEVTPTSAKLAGGWLGRQPKPVLLTSEGESA